MVYLLVPGVLGVAAASAWLAYRSVDFRKFLAGAFLVSGGVQLYLAAAGVSVPVLGTEIVQTPDVGWVRGAFHLGLGGVAVYFGFWRGRGVEPTRRTDA